MRYKEIEDTVFILNTIASEIEQGLNGSIYVNRLRDRDFNKDNIEYSLARIGYRYGLMRVACFLDEYYRQFLKLIDNGMEVQRVRSVEHIIKPALDEIEKYSGLRNYRNWLVAHNYRVQKDGYANAFRGDYIANIDIPNTEYDYLVIRNCINLCIKVINRIFSDYYISYHKFIEDYNTKHTRMGIMYEKDYNDIMNLIENDINSRFENIQ